jgi:GNAT superfamily N-acetyltransferase
MDPRSYSASDKSRDGTFVRIRAIRQDDGSAIEIDPDADVSLVATVWIEGRERIVGFASYVVDPWSEPCRAEVAFVVLDDWQGRGIGSLLFAHLARIALRLRVDVFCAVVAASNRHALRVFETSGFAGEVEYDGAEAWVTLDLRGTGIVIPPAVAALL